MEYCVVYDNSTSHLEVTMKDDDDDDDNDESDSSREGGFLHQLQE